MQGYLLGKPEALGDVPSFERVDVRVGKAAMVQVALPELAVAAKMAQVALRPMWRSGGHSDDRWLPSGHG